MSRSSTARVTAAAAGSLALLAGAASFMRRLRLRKGGSMADAKEISRRLTEDPWQGKIDDVIDYVADDYIGHNAGVPEPVVGKAGYREFVGTYLAAFPDGKITVDDQIAEGDTVTTRWTAVGTNTGELMGMAATGKEVTVSGITYSKISDGQLQEAWTSWDTLGMLQQLGAVPAAAPTRT